MSLQLSGESERLTAFLLQKLGTENYKHIEAMLRVFYDVNFEGIDQPYKEFYGPMHVQMERLRTGKNANGNVIDCPRDSASFAFAIDRRETAPEDVRDNWKDNDIYTKDGSVAGVKGDSIILPNSKHLRELNANSKLYNGAFVLSEKNAWTELKSWAKKGNGLYLTAKQVEELNGKGYIKKNGIWTPENSVVGDTWYTLTEGKDLRNYAEGIGQLNPNRTRIMTVHLNSTVAETENGKNPTVRPFVAVKSDSNSGACGRYDINSNLGRLVGLSVEGAVREKIIGLTLEDLVTIVNNPDLNREGMIIAITAKYQN